MSSDKDPKSHYSYEEMVARLRENRSQASRVKSEERELDPDTGKVTVRRQKKRRTSTGKTGILKDPKWYLIIRRAIYIGAPLVAILLVVCYVIVAASTSSGRFQTGLGASLGRTLGLTHPVEIKDSSLGGLTLGIKKAMVPGSAEGSFRQGTAEGIEFRLHPKSFLGGDWEVETCVINKADIQLRAPLAGQATAAAPSVKLQAAGFLLSNEPANIHFPDITIARANLIFGGTDPLKSPGLRAIRASLLERVPDTGSPYYDVQISGGRDGQLVLPGWPPMKVETMRMETRDGGLLLKRSVLHLGDEEASAKDGGISMIEAKGTIPFRAGDEANIEVTLRRILLMDLMPKAANRYLGGVLRSDGLILTYDCGDPVNTWRLRGPIILEPARLRGLRLISLLQQVTGGEMAAMDFEECTFTLDMNARQTRLIQIHAIGAGRAQITGDLEISANGQLNGDLKLGLSNEILLDKVPDFFKPGDAACAWTPLKVGGLVTSPSEDLSPKLQVWLAEQGVKMPVDAPAGEGDPLDQDAAPKRSGNGNAPVNRDEYLKDLYDDLLKQPEPKPRVDR